MKWPAGWKESGVSTATSMVRGIISNLPLLLLALVRKTTLSAHENMSTPAFIVVFFLCLVLGYRPTAAGDSRKSKRRIFCYGDSLTAGYVPSTGEFFPYAKVLQEYLDIMHAHVEVDYKGLSGWRAEDLVKGDGTLQKRLESGQRDAEPVDMVIILAGTNDLGKADDEKIFKSVWKIHSICHKENVATIAISVPSSIIQKNSPSLAQTRANLNNSIKSQCRLLSQCTYVECPVVYTQETKETLFSFDGLHFTKEGYSQLAKRLVPVVLRALGMEKKSQLLPSLLSLPTY